MRVPMFEFDGWTCTYEPRRGHTFTRGRSTIVMRRGRFPGQILVQRDWIDRTFNLSVPPYGPDNGGEQGGWGIVLMPTWTPETRRHMDGTIARHPVGFFNEDGTPWMGDGKRYPLVATPLPNGKQKHDGPHYVRAYMDAVAEFGRTRDPAARAHIILCAVDVQRRFPLFPFIDGEGPEYSLSTMRKNTMLFPRMAKLGVVRELAWSLRCLVEAKRTGYRNDEYIRTFVSMLEDGQADNGTFADNYYGEGASEDGQPWTVQQPGYRLLATNEGECPAFQLRFLYRALWEAQKVLPDLRASVRGMLTLAKALEDGCMKVPDGYRPDLRGLPRWIITSRDGRLLDRVVEGVGAADTTYDADMRQVFSEAGV